MTAFPLRGARLAAATLVLTLLAGCDESLPASAAALPDWSHGVGFSPNCVGKPAVVLRAKFDINGDDDPDWFIVFRCPEAAAARRGDQLEVLDGGSDRSQPRPLGSHPLIHPEDGIIIAAGGCLMFIGGKVFVADRRQELSSGWHVARIGTWRKDHVVMEKPAQDVTLPCDQTR
jgi:hypothetical protein